MNKKSFIKTGLIAFLAGFVLLTGCGSKPEADEEVYVTKVSEITGISGHINRFGGVVESKEVWKTDKNSEYKIKNIYVAEGDKVKAGDPLFDYDEEQFNASLDQANIDMERLVAEKENIESTIAELEADKLKASGSDQAAYTIQIKAQELEYKQKELEIKSKQIEIDKLNDNISNSTVVSGIDGIVQSVNDGNTYYGSEDNSFIKIMKIGNFRVKGSVNEQNIGQLYEGMEVIVASRVNDTTWDGVITKVDMENQESNNNMYYYGGGNNSTSYPFYIELDDSNGLMLGQHVYIKEKQEETKDGIYLDMFYIDMTDESAPFVWADDGNGKLKKKEVTIEEFDDFGRALITDGLSYDDAIAFPMEELKAGMKCSMIETENYFDDSSEAMIETAKL